MIKRAFLISLLFAAKAAAFGVAVVKPGSQGLQGQCFLFMDLKNPLKATVRHNYKGGEGESFETTEISFWTIICPKKEYLRVFNVKFRDDSTVKFSTRVNGNFYVWKFEKLIFKQPFCTCNLCKANEAFQLEGSHYSPVHDEDIIHNTTIPDVARYVPALRNFLSNQAKGK